MHGGILPVRNEEGDTMTLRNVRSAAECVPRRAAHESGTRPRFSLEDAAEERAIVAIRAALSSSPTVRAALERIAAAVDDAMPLRALVVVPRDERERSLVWSASRRDRAAAEADVVAAAALAWFLPDSADDALASSAPPSRFAWISLPVVDDDGRVLGLLAVSTTTAPVTERHVAFVAAVARTLAEPMSRAAPSPHVARADRTVALPELASLLFDNLDYASTLQDVVRVAGSEIADACVVVLDGRNGAERIAFAPTFDDCALDLALRGVAAAALARGETIATAQRDPIALSAARKLGVETIVSCMIVNRGAALGTLTLVAREPTARLDVGDVEQLARRAAVAVENGRAYEAAIDGLADRDRVLSTVSHDLRNPLGVILLATSRALEEIDDADSAGRRQMETIRRSALRMRKLVADLLDAAAIDGGAMSMRPARWELRLLVDEAFDAIALAATESGVRLVGEIAPDLPHVWADGDRILQVFANLLGNALKFTPRGGAIVVRARVDRDMVRIAVTDSGCGIAREDLPRVFDRFWQSAEAARLGTGLGLAICKAIVELSGGSVEAESEIGVGTTIGFTLPISRRGPALARARTVER
ncbi:MAG TPA: HAMP domain-containing sensor histidine kinase [Labilithrix sp.]